jgi:hypothetical protein
MNAIFKASALLAASASLATALPASAATSYHSTYDAPTAQSQEYGRDRYGREDYRRGYRGDYRSDYRGSYRDDYRNSGRYDQRVYRDTRVWRGDNGRYYCRKQNGTTGLLIGGAVGALLGHQLAGGNDKTIGALVGAAGGAAIGKAIDDGDIKCR